jgi:hypothetical protein
MRRTVGMALAYTNLRSNGKCIMGFEGLGCWEGFARLDDLRPVGDHRAFEQHVEDFLLYKPYLSAI